MISNYFKKKQVLGGNFGEIWGIEIQLYPQTYIGEKLCLFYLQY